MGGGEVTGSRDAARVARVWQLLWTWEVIEGGVSGTLGSRLGFKELDGRCSHSPRNRIRADFMAGRRGAGRASSDLVAL